MCWKWLFTALSCCVLLGLSFGCSIQTANADSVTVAATPEIDADGVCILRNGKLHRFNDFSRRQRINLNEGELVFCPRQPSPEPPKFDPPPFDNVPAPPVEKEDSSLFGVSIQLVILIAIVAVGAVLLGAYAARQGDN